MDEAGLRGLMGLSVRAGQAVFGEDGCMKALRGGGCALLLMDGAISGAAREKYLGVCARTGTRSAVLPEGLIAQATGRPGKAMAVRRGALADRLAACLDEAEETTGYFKA